MAGRPRTQHKRVKATLDQLLAVETQLIDLIPEKYAVRPDDESELPWDDLGYCWRKAVDDVMVATEYLEVLEYVLSRRAERHNPGGPETAGVADPGGVIVSPKADITGS